MGRDDLYLALERHATGKVRSADHLGFCFRGEALPSIASVTRLELTSADEDGSGHRLRCELGIIERPHVLRGAAQLPPRQTDHQEY